MNKTKTKTQTQATDAPPQPTSTPAKPSKKGALANQPTAPKHPKSAKSPADREVADRLPATSDELQQTKGGFVAFHFLAGKDKDAIAKDLATAFKLADAQAMKITRRITARVRLYQRIFELIPLKN